MSNDNDKGEVYMLPRWSADLSLYGLLKEFSRENRQHETEAEGILWSYIRNKQLGVKFLRQFIVDKYILDFVCRETKLVIEVMAHIMQKDSKKKMMPSER